jgi:hypothetical protein
MKKEKVIWSQILDLDRILLQGEVFSEKWWGFCHQYLSNFIDEDSFISFDLRCLVEILRFLVDIVFEEEVSLLLFALSKSLKDFEFFLHALAKWCHAFEWYFISLPFYLMNVWLRLFCCLSYQYVMNDMLSFQEFLDLLLALLIEPPCSFLIVKLCKLPCFEIFQRLICILNEIALFIFGFNNDTCSHSFK